MQYDLNKILVIDKPANITSAKVVACVKGLVGAKKTGHTGTLDPFATGVYAVSIEPPNFPVFFYTAIKHMRRFSI